MAYIDEAPRKTRALVKALQVDKNIPVSNKKLAEKYVDYMSARGLSIKTVYKNLYCLTIYLKAMGGTDVLKATRTQIESGVARIEASEYAPKTKQNIKIVIKSIYKHFLGEDLYYPKQVAWIKATLKMSNRLLPQDMLSEEEVLRMLETAGNERDKAIIALLFDSGIRVGELLNMRVKDVKIGEEPACITVTGKTGMRQVPIVFSVPYLAQHLNATKSRAPEDFLWRARGTWSNSGLKFDYNGIRKMLKEVGNGAKLSKRIYPHLFRHSRATYYANKLTEQQLKVFFGWTGGSDMASTYVHLSGRDINNAVLLANGLKVPQAESAPKLTAKVCKRCQFSNTIESAYCNRCGAPLDIGTAMKAQEAEAVLKASLLESMTDPKVIEEIVHAYLMMQKKTGKT